MVIRDNGKGMDEETVAAINAGGVVKGEENGHIGINNAINRIHIYCKAREKIRIESELNMGTEITIWIPIDEISEKYLV